MIKSAGKALNDGDERINSFEVKKKGIFFLTREELRKVRQREQKVLFNQNEI